MLEKDCNTMGNSSLGEFSKELLNEDDTDPVEHWEPPPSPTVIHSQSSSTLSPLEKSLSGTVSVSRSGCSDYLDEVEIEFSILRSVI